MPFRVSLLACLALLLLPAAPASPTVSRADTLVRGDDRFGVGFVNAPGYPSPDTRYAQAQSAGVRWSRWPIYWQEIETSPGSFNYAPQDAVVNADAAHGIQTAGILLGVPGWMSGALRPEGARPFPRVGPQPGLSGADRPSVIASPERAAAAVTPSGGIRNLYAPVFQPDGSINPDNYWARFVYGTVSRYKDRVKIWEIWNEPDLKDPSGNGIFWQGSTEDYYQLLKVGYLATKKADPTATVLFGGLSYWSDPSFFSRILDLMARDGSAPANNYYFDVLPLHFYSSAYNIYTMPRQFMDQLRGRGLNKPVWINEANLPVCSDPIDPSFTCPQTYRGTPEEQANFVLQAFAEAGAAGLGKLFIFQLYDDGVGPHEYYGLIRNNNDPRPALAAYRTAAAYLSGPTSVSRSVEANGQVERIVFEGTPRGRVTVLWARGPSGVTATVPATQPSGTLVDKRGNATGIPAVGGAFRVNLAGATNRDPSGAYNVGGDPAILVEMPVRYTTSQFFPIAGRR